MPPEVSFWFSPSKATVIWSVVGVIVLVALVFVVRALYKRLVHRRYERELTDKLEAIDLLERPEEEVIRDLVKRYGIHPPVGLLNQLSLYDQIAGQELQRVEVTPMALSDRIDRIEYLYSIRLHAFSSDPSVGGLDVLVGKEDGPVLSARAEIGAEETELPPLRAEEAVAEEAAEEPPEEEPLLETPVDSTEDGRDEDSAFDQLLSSPTPETGPGEKRADDSGSEET